MISAAMDFWMITLRNFEGPSASCGESQFCSKNTPVGIDVPTTARGWNLAYGLFSVGETEGVQGERREISAQWAVRRRRK